MNNNQTNVAITKDILAKRDSAKFFYGEKYSEKITSYIELLELVMKSQKLDPIGALLNISKTNIFKDNQVGQLMFYAATADIIDQKQKQKEILAVNKSNGGVAKIYNGNIESFTKRT